VEYCIPHTARPTPSSANTPSATDRHDRLEQHIDEAKARLASSSGAAGAGLATLGGSAHGVIGFGSDFGRIGHVALVYFGEHRCGAQDAAFGEGGGGAASAEAVVSHAGSSNRIDACLCVRQLAAHWLVGQFGVCSWAFGRESLINLLGPNGGLGTTGPPPPQQPEETCTLIHAKDCKSPVNCTEETFSIDIRCREK